MRFGVHLYLNVSIYSLICPRFQIRKGDGFEAVESKPEGASRGRWLELRHTKDDGDVGDQSHANDLRHVKHRVSTQAQIRRPRSRL